MIKTGNKIAKNFKKYNVPTQLINLENLPEGDYRIEVVAENCYGIQSEPLCSD